MMPIPMGRVSIKTSPTLEAALVFPTAGGPRAPAADMRIVHNRGEEVIGKNQRLVFVDLINGGVVVIFDTNEQRLVGVLLGNIGKQRVQGFRLYLATTATTLGKLRQSNCQRFCAQLPSNLKIHVHP